MKINRTLSLLALVLFTASTPAFAGMDILACSTPEKAAITPTDPLNCQWKNGLLDATLAQLYVDGWRLVEVGFFNGDREVLYLERPIAAAAATKP
ncbi:MAG: hypothetical protein ACT4PZ_16330 [Panacagrimonas sp.]